MWKFIPIEYISEEADLIESQDNLITADSLVENENSNNEKPKINLIIEKSQDSSRNVHILTQQSIEISEEATACSPIDEKNEDHLKKKSDEFYYPMLQLEDGSTAYISIPQELLPSMGLCLEENNVNNEEHEESKQIEVYTYLIIILFYNDIIVYFHSLSNIYKSVQKPSNSDSLNLKSNNSKIFQISNLDFLKT